MCVVGHPRITCKDQNNMQHAESSDEEDVQYIFSFFTGHMNLQNAMKREKRKEKPKLDVPGKQEGPHRLVLYQYLTCHQQCWI